MGAPKKRTRKRVLGGLSAFAAVALVAGALGPVGSSASSHREAPLTSADPQIDQTDLYAFTSPDDPSSVTFVSSWIPFEEPAGGPNFYTFSDGVRYDVNISNDADAKPEIIYRWIFDTHYRNPNTFLYNTGQVTSLNDSDLNIYQTYDLLKVVPGKTPQRLLNDKLVAPSDVGAASFPDYEAVSNEAVTPLATGGKAWVGQSDDPFFLDLRVFDLLYGADFSEVGDDTLEGFNVNTMALQIPKAELAKNANLVENPVIGVWNTASRRSTRIQGKDGSSTYEGKWVQVSRLGSPLVNEVVVPVGSKDYFNASKPVKDEQFLGAVQDPELPHLIEAIYGIPAPDSDSETAGIQRADLIQVFLTGVDGLNQPANVEPSEMLRLNMNTPACTTACSPLGVIGGDTAGFPNGRRLTDDVIDIALQVVEGELIGNENDLGDGVGTNDVGFRGMFPYVALPHRGSDTAPHDG